MSNAMSAASFSQLSAQHGLCSELHIVCAAGLLPHCKYCAEHGIEYCCHLVPPIPKHEGASDGMRSCCNEPGCQAVWSEKDPVAEGWLVKKGCKLLDTGGMQFVDEYVRKCSKQ